MHSIVRNPAALGIVAGSIVLAIKPLIWLAGTWYAPGYDSIGWVVFALVAVVFVWSLASERPQSSASRASTAPPAGALGLLLLAAAVRLAAQLLAIDLIGALTLAVDVYALGLLARLHERARAVSPFWLAVMFCFCLPVENVLQRLLGYALQQLSALGACGLLQHTFDTVRCSGVRIVLDGRDVLVDLPCSGAQLLTHTLALFSLLAALRRPSLRAALVGLVIAAAAAWLANSLRIAVLAVGIADPGVFGGTDLMAQPWHDAVGLYFVALAGAVVAIWAAHVAPAPPAARPRPSAPLPSRWRNMAGIAYAVAAIGIVSLAPSPVDVSRPVPLPELPLVVAGTLRESQPLSTQEQRYFTQYGGTAARASYGPFALLLVGTTSPLRHLHAPDVCLEGAGHDVRYVGAKLDALPTAVYRSRAPDGGDWRIDVSFVSADGHVAPSVAEAVWYWLTESASAWTMVQRISPWHEDPALTEDFAAGVVRALNIQTGDRHAHAFSRTVSHADARPGRGAGGHRGGSGRW